MRYIVGSLCILLLIMGFTVWNAHTMADVTARAAAYVDEAAAAASSGDMESAARSAQGLDRYWSARRDYLESVLMHEELDDVAATISDFVSAAISGDEDAFYANARLLGVRLRHLAEIEEFSIGNIL